MEKKSVKKPPKNKRWQILMCFLMEKMMLENFGTMILEAGRKAIEREGLQILAPNSKTNDSKITNSSCTSKSR